MWSGYKGVLLPLLCSRVYKVRIQTDIVAGSLYLLPSQTPYFIPLLFNTCKMLRTTLTTLLLSLSLVTATPISFTFPLIARDTLSESQILAIAPNSQTCDNPPAKGECATAKQAAKFTAQSFDTYQVTSKAEQAAIISLMAFESDDFKYNKNHFPGTPGQGSKFFP